LDLGDAEEDELEATTETQHCRQRYTDGSEDGDLGEAPGPVRRTGRARCELDGPPAGVLIDEMKTETDGGEP
jgi:hypothetical protein